MPRDLTSEMQVLKFEAQETKRENGRVLVASGNRSRNVDFWSGKPYRLNPSGMRTEHWEKNPLVFYMHNFFIPLGTGSGMYVENNQLWMPDDIQFHRQTVPVPTEFGIGDFDTGVIADLWDERVLQAVSIHVMMTPEDLENIVETDEEIFIATSEVLEVSVVTVPGDRDAKREHYERDLLEAMVRKGVDREMAECVACNTLPTYVPPMAVINSDLSATSGSKNVEIPEVSMSVELVEEATVETEVEQEIEPTEVEITAQVDEVIVEHEFELSVVELADAIVQDGQALFTLALALVELPEFVQAIAEAVEERSDYVLNPMELVSSPHRIKMVLVGSERQKEPVVEQTAQPVLRPVSVQQAAAAPVALPQANGAQKRRKPTALDLVRPAQ